MIEIMPETYQNILFTIAGFILGLNCYNFYLSIKSPNPTVCAKCKSPYWDKPRVEEQK